MSPRLSTVIIHNFQKYGRVLANLKNILAGRGDRPQTLKDFQKTFAPASLTHPKVRPPDGAVRGRIVVNLRG